MQNNQSFIRKLKRRTNIPLYQILASSGELDLLKSRVRSKLILELNKNAKISKSIEDGYSITQNSYTELANKIVLNHLLFHQFTYTMSVFVPECGMPSDLMSGFNVQDNIRKLLSATGNSNIDRKLSVLMESSHGSVVEELLRKLEGYFDIPVECRYTQTEHQISEECYDDRLRCIDRHFENRRELEIEHTKKIFDNQMDVMRQQIEAESRENLKFQMEQFRQIQMLQIRQEMEEKYRIQSSESQRKLETEYQKRLKTLDDQQRQWQMQAELDRQKHEREAYLRRQAIQAEVESMREQILSISQEKDQLDKERRDMLKEYEKRQLELDLREKELMEKENLFEHRVHEEVQKCRMEDETRLLHQKKENEYKATQLEENRQTVERERQMLRRIKEDLLKQKLKFTEMEIAEYEMIKTQNGTLQTEVAALHKELTEAQKEIQEQKKKMLVCQSELAGVHVQSQEVERLRECLNSERSAFSEERRQLQAKIDKQNIQMLKLVDHLKRSARTLLRPSSLSELHCCYSENVTPNIVEQSHMDNFRSLTKINSMLPENDSDQDSYSDFNDPKQFVAKKRERIGQSVDYWTTRLEESRKRMSRLKAESEQLETAYDRWYAANAVKSVVPDYETQMKVYLPENKMVQPSGINYDVACAMSPQIGTSATTAVFSMVHNENQDKVKIETCQQLSVKVTEDCAKVNAISLKETYEATLSQKQSSIAAPVLHTKGGTSLVYDDTGVSTRTHESHSELSVEIDDNIRSKGNQTVVRTPILFNTSNKCETRQASNKEHDGKAAHSSCSIIGSPSIPAKQSQSADKDEKAESNAQTDCEISLEAADCLSEYREEQGLESIRRSIESLDQFNTPVISARREQSSCSVPTQSSAESTDDESQTHVHESPKSSARPGTDDLMKRYLELSKTTNRVSEAARIEEQNDEVRQAAVCNVKNEDSKGLSLMRFFNNHQFLSSDSDSEASLSENVPQLDELSTGRIRSDQTDPSENAW